MGIDIDGAIETCEADGVWDVEFDLLDFALGRYREPWDVLFGYWGNPDVKRPLFAERGLPDNASESVRETGNEDYQRNHTYVTWAEIAAVDWDAPISDGLAWNWVGEWRPDATGRLVLHDVCGASPVAYQGEGEFEGHGMLAPREWPPGAEVRHGGSVYRPVVLTPRMVMPDDGRWDRVWDAMRELAVRYGAENVRLVCWFG
ncbi:hypothetical protein ACH4SP_27260 [Streptomyces sp. NPDC021093]|uniref:hypothetical protein n=1 Tax=Streptomyces sp. NPDC021093 TaxID=3365112 RepID=UPI00379946DE